MSRHVATCRDSMLLAKAIKLVELGEPVMHRALPREPFFALAGRDLFAFDMAFAASALQRALGNRATVRQKNVAGGTQ
jgi:hypothetical protein